MGDSSYCLTLTILVGNSDPASIPTQTLRRSLAMPRCLLFAVVVVFIRSGPAYSVDPDRSIRHAYEACTTIKDDAARLRCFENATSEHAQPAPQSSTDGLDGWRLVRTPRSEGGGDIISMMRTADGLRSDPDFAGLTLRCGPDGPEIVVIVIQPFPPRARPTVTFGGPINEVHLKASVLPSGAALLLPGEATMLAKGPWQAQVDLPVKIEDGETTIHGVVPLGGLSTALQMLAANCSPR